MGLFKKMNSTLQVTDEVLVYNGYNDNPYKGIITGETKLYWKVTLELNSYNKTEDLYSKSSLNIKGGSVWGSSHITNYNEEIYENAKMTRLRKKLCKTITEKIIDCDLSTLKIIYNLLNKTESE